MNCGVLLTVMLEAAADNVPQPVFMNAIKEGVKHTDAIVRGIKSLCKKCGREKRVVADSPTLDAEILDAINRYERGGGGVNGGGIL